MTSLPLPLARVWVPMLTASIALAAGVAPGGVRAAQTPSASGLRSAAAGLHELVLHDTCTGAYPPQPDTCLH